MANTLTKLNILGTDTYIASTAYATCATEAAKPAKVANIQDSSSNVFKLDTGVSIHVKFTNTNTVDNPTLNVNGTGAKAIKKYGTTAVGKTVYTSWQAGAVVTLTYDGTNWIMNDHKNETTGDITGVTAGNGLTGGASSGSATLNVGAGSGISVTADAVAHADTSTLEGSYGPTADVTQSAKSTASIVVPQITVDGFGHVTAVTNRTLTVTDTNTDTNTDTKVTQNYSTASNSYPVLLSATAGTSSTSGRGATTSILCNTIYANPSLGALVASKLYEGTTALSDKYQAKGSYAAAGHTHSGYASSSHAHGNISSDGSIASTVVTSATGVLVYDSNNKIQRATAAQTRAIIGAGTSSLSLGTTATTAAKGNHTHTATIAESTGTNELTLKHGTKYALTAGGDTFVFTMPTDNNTVYTHPSSHPASMITGLATVATSGKYSDLSGRPTIPTVPSSLKNPNAVTIKAGSDTVASYDGSAAKTFTIAASSTAGAFTISDGTTTKTVQLAGKFTDNNTTYGVVGANGTTGLIKNGSSVTSASGYTACPIIGGVPYYKDTNSTYSLRSFGVTATAAELNYCDGVTSNIQTQLNILSSGLDTVGNLIPTVDTTLSNTSSNAIANKTVFTALQDTETNLNNKLADYQPKGTITDADVHVLAEGEQLDVYLDTLDTRVSTLERSSGGSGGGLTEGGSLNSATIGDFYCKYINDSTSTSSYVSVADLIYMEANYATRSWVTQNFVRKCLLEGTQITMADGTRKPIQDVQEGDLVKSINVETGEETQAVVLANSIGDVENYYFMMMFEDGSSLKTNWTHDIYNATKGTWVKSDCEMYLDDEVIKEDNSRTKFIGTIDTIGTISGKRCNFYDIVVSNNCYYADGILCASNPVIQLRWLIPALNKNAERIPQELKDLIASYRDEDTRESDLVHNNEYMNEYIPQMAVKMKKEARLRQLQAELSKTDYVSIKASEGVEITPEMQEVIEARAWWRELYNEAEAELNTVNETIRNLKVKHSPLGEDILLDNMELRKKFFLESCNKANSYLSKFKEFYNK